MFWSLSYVVVRCVLQILLLRPRSRDFKGLEIVVLRHEPCGVRKLGSRGGTIFVNESAESVSALDAACRRVRDLQLPSQGIGRLQIE